MDHVLEFTCELGKVNQRQFNDITVNYNKVSH